MSSAESDLPHAMPPLPDFVLLAETHPPPSGLDTDEILAAKANNANALNGTEIWWQWYQPWLLKRRGYLLRPRYRPGWEPPAQVDPAEREDCAEQTSVRVLDATRIIDGKHVLLKITHDDSHGDSERTILEYLWSPELRSDPRNHTVPLLDVFELPQNGGTVLVMPFLRAFDDPAFETVGEAVEFFRQIFEGVQFMHDRKIAHGDFAKGNIMYDASPMYPEGFHAIDTDRSRNWERKTKSFTRTQRPVCYVLIDFGTSVRIEEGDSGLVYPAHGRDYCSAPEHRPERVSNQVPHDPFPADIYYLGNFIKTEFVEGRLGFEFMRELVDDMIKEDPAERPTMPVVVGRFHLIRWHLPWWTLRRPVDSRRDSAIVRVSRTARVVLLTQSAFWP
ncbi:unnamed protein product [Peniophora sp. CBMAI 1063]|nr:unnamed protein product [Peniophora sp. CBMAI 1063]